MSVVSSVEIFQGNTRTFTVNFAVPDDAGTPTDPTTVTFYRRKVDGSSAEQWVYPASEISKVGVGVYAIALAFDEPGVWAVGAEGVGACHAYSEWRVVVHPAGAKP